MARRKLHNLERVDRIGRAVQTAIVVGLNCWIAWGLAAAIAQSIAG